jgi:flavin reductase (DIM6/NTAB) family NADH-FMN oxidoreductase RutF
VVVAVADGNGRMTISRDGKRGAGLVAAMKRPEAAEEGDAPESFPENPALELRARFRASLRHLASSVALLTSAHDGRRGGLTATAACSLSVDPPLMLVCVNRRSRTHEFMRGSDRFAINYLGAHHRELARLFARLLPDSEAKFSIGEWGTSSHGNPILLDSLATVECSVLRRVDEGTHSIFIGTVLDATIRNACDPLLYVEGGFAALLRDGG